MAEIPKIRHVGAAVNFSSKSGIAARAAYAIARAHGADVTLIHAYEPFEQRHPTVAAVLPAAARDQLEQTAKHEAHAALADLVDELVAEYPNPPRPKVWCEVAEGLAPTALHLAAQEAAIDLFVIGSRGKSQLGSWVLGSVTRDVAASAHCPVLIVSSPLLPGWKGAFARMLIGIGEQRLAPWLVRSCQAIGAVDFRATLLHAVPSPAFLNNEITADDNLLSAGSLSLAAAELAVFREQLGLDPERFAARVEPGRPAPALLDYATELGADLIAVGSHAREDLGDRLLGTTAERILRRSDLPVLMFPSTALPENRTAVRGNMGHFAELNGGACKTYLVASTSGEAMIVDPLFERVDHYIAELDRRGVELDFVVDTHVHADHLSGGPRLAEATGATYVVHDNSASVCAGLRVGEGYKLGLGHLEARVLHTPGHARDAITLVFPDRMLTGDFLFIGEGGAGRTDLPGGDAVDHWSALKKLSRYDGDMLVFPGHDYRGYEFSTIASERVNNPRLQPRKVEDYVAWLDSHRLDPADWMVEVIRANYACEQATAVLPGHARPTSEVEPDSR